MKKYIVSIGIKFSLILGISGIIIALLFLEGCEKKNSIYQLNGKAMGTTWSAKIVLPGHSKLTNQEVQKLIQTKLDQVDRLASTWNPNSQVSKFNALKKRKRMKLSPIIYHAIVRSKHWYYKTNGNFNITLEPLIKAWGFDSSHTSHPPNAQKITQLLQRTGVPYIQFFTKTQSIRKLKQGLKINLSGIIKGYSVDLVSKELIQAGISNFVIEVGGEIYVHGQRHDGKLWNIGIVNPGKPLQIWDTLKVKNKGIATSGNYLNYYYYKGRRYTHIINPATGYPISVQHPLSVTVVMNRTEDADAVATAMIVYGIDIGLAVANRHNWPVYFLVAISDSKSNVSKMVVKGYASSAYKALIQGSS